MASLNLDALILTDMHLHRHVKVGTCKACGGTGEELRANAWSVSSVARELGLSHEEVRGVMKKFADERKICRVGGPVFFGDDSKEYPESDDWLYSLSEDQPQMTNDSNSLFREPLSATLF